jgi:hypothetical protein
MDIAGTISAFIDLSGVRGTWALGIRSVAT